ncbi:Scr1 family TA system antitoxin-like transcriptional regulator [Streptomyces sp. NPDC002205]|uniref:DUF397 domain-containing protein n=1 Tax=Streptomyces sp. NPDC002205 TaxID=3154411 RepID=UPI00332E9241
MAFDPAPPVGLRVSTRRPTGGLPGRWRQGEFGEDDLADRAGFDAPVVGELGDDQQPASVPLVGGGHAQARQPFAARIARLDTDGGGREDQVDPEESVAQTAVQSMVEYVALEDIATGLRTWQLSIVPGLLQTPDYARALAVGNGSCVEVARNIPDTAAVRDSKRPTGPVLIIGPTAWDAFQADLRRP